MVAADVGDLFGVGGDKDAGELGAGAGGLVDPGEHGFAGDGAKDFAGQARRGEAGGNDSEDGERLRWRLLSAVAGIKYDWSCLCRGGSPSFPRRVTFQPARLIHT